MILIYIAHHRLNRLGMTRGIVAKLVESPFGAVVDRHAIAVHEIDAARHIVVVPTVGIHGTVGLHHLPHPLAEVGSLGRTSGTLALAGPLGVERMFHLDTLGHGVILRLGIPCQSAQSCDIATLSVVVETCHALEILVHREPCRTVVSLRHLLVNTRNNPEPPSRYGSIDDERIGVGLHLGDGIGETVVRHMVEVGHHVAGVVADAGLVLAPFEFGLAHNGGAPRLLDLHLSLDAVGGFLVACCFCLFELAEQSPVLKSFLLEEVASQHLHHLLP